MPVTIKPTDVIASPYRWAGEGPPWKGRIRLRGTSAQPVTTTEQLLEASLKFEGEPPATRSRKIYASSQSDTFPNEITPSINGFLQSAVDAYSGHHHLLIRPDDVWIAILTQLSSYVQANAEELRHLFVSHEGVLDLVIVDNDASTVDQLNYRAFLDAMPALMEKHIKDSELRTWIQPAFTTTTDVDNAVTSIIFMSTMQKYFDYTLATRCALPSVTLLGEKADWEKLLGSAEKLVSFGAEPAKWHNMLRPVLRKFVQSFESPEAQDIVEFWQNMVHCNKSRSGSPHITGWLVAFCYFNEEGATVATTNEHPAADGILYGSASLSNMPLGYTTVPLSIQDTARGIKFEATMRAGMVGTEIRSSGDPREDGTVGDDTVVPFVGWWIYKKTESEKKAAEGESRNITGKSVAVMSRRRRR